MSDRPNPILWVERLLNVNAGSDFIPEQKIVIASALRELMCKLGAEVITSR